MKEKVVGLRRAAAALAFFGLLAVVHTWPLASAPGRWSRNDAADTVLNEWTLAWVAHQAVTDPAHLFDANIFYPARGALAFSEHLLPQSAMVAPILWAGGSPVLAYNVALLLGFALTGWATYLLVARWTSSRAAGLVTGSLAAFNAHSLTRLTHVQAQHLEFLPLALLALDRLLSSPRLRHAVSLAGWSVLQSLCSGYSLVFTAVSLAVAAAARPGDWLGARRWQVGAMLCLAAVLASAVLVPFLMPYWHVRRDYGLVRTLDDAADYSAHLTDYLATGASIHWPWSARFFRGDALFPGVVALGLALVGVCLAVRGEVRARMCVATGAVAFLLSLGTRLPLYGWLYRALPLLQGFRAPVRFGQVVLLATAILAGYGMAWVLRQVHGRRQVLVLAAAAILAVNVEALRAPFTFYEFEGVPPIYRTLAQQPSAVVVCFPFYWSGAEGGLNTRYMLGSTLNWRPMLNGYSGFMPAASRRAAQIMESFPNEASLRFLRETGVTHVIVDTRKTSEPRLKAIESNESLGPWAADGTIRIFRLK